MDNCTKKDKEFYRRIGSKGGKQTFARHGHEHMSRIGRKGFDATTEKYFRNEREHKLFLAEMGAYTKRKSADLKYARDGVPIFPDQKPTHPAHRDFTEF